MLPILVYSESNKILNKQNKFNVDVFFLFNWNHIYTTYYVYGLLCTAFLWNIF